MGPESSRIEGEAAEKLCPHGKMPSACDTCRAEKQPANAAEKEAVPEAGANLDVAKVRSTVDDERCFPAKVIEALREDPYLDRQYGKGTGVVEKYTLAQHTVMVMVQFERYFAARPLPAGVDRAFFRSMLALHDIGKPQSLADTRKGANQHEHNAPVARTVIEKLGFDAAEADIAEALLADDPIGRFMKAKEKDPERWAARIEELSRRTNLGPKEYYDLLKTLYMVDAGAYTSDAGGRNTLDHLFEFDRASGEMRLSQKAADDMDELEAELDYRITRPGKQG